MGQRFVFLLRFYIFAELLISLYRYIKNLHYSVIFKALEIQSVEVKLLYPVLSFQLNPCT